MRDLVNSDYSKVVLFVVFGILVGSVVDWLLKRFALPIPYTVLVFYIGILLSILRDAVNSKTGQFIEESTVSADLIVYVFLPALLFREAMNLNLYHVQKGFYQSILLAGPGAVFVGIELAICAYYMLPFNWPWLYCFLFGSILCATDPVAVVGLLKRANASSRLTTIITGEALLNDGSSMTMFFFFANLIKGRTYTAASLIEFVLEMFLASPLIGLAFGIVARELIKRFTTPTKLNIDIQIIITLVCGYGSFYVAEGPAKLSGVLSCVTAGVTLALFVTPKILMHEKMHEVWSVIEWVCNTLIFLLGGLIGGSHSAGTVTVRSICYLLLMYVMLVLTRVVMVALFFPLISKIGLTCSATEAQFVAFSGLRGALAIALALVAASEAENDDDGKLDDSVGNQVFFMVTGLVSLTLLFNGSTAGWVLLQLRLVDDPNAPPSAQLNQVLERIKSFLTKEVREELESMKTELGDYDEKEVERLCRLMNTDSEFDVLIPRSSSEGGGEQGPRNEWGLEYSTESRHHQQNHGRINKRAQNSSGDSEDDSERGSGGSDEENSSPRNFHSVHLSRASGTMDVDGDLVAYTRHTFCEVLRARYVESIEMGRIGSSNSAAKLLLYSVDVSMDHVKRCLSDFPSIESFLKPNRHMLQVCRWIDDFFHYTIQIYPGFVSKLDAKAERVAIYTLINYIDAHEYALSQMHHFLGGPKENSNEFDIAQPEEAQVRRESELCIDKARYLLRTIAFEDVRKVYTHRAAKVIVLKQASMLSRMVQEGSISDKNARHLFKTIEDDRDRIDIERESHDRSFVKDTKTRKVAEEKEMRESLAVRQSALSLTAVDAGSRGSDVGTPSRLLSSSTQSSVSVFSPPKGSPVIPRRSLRENLTGEDDLDRVSQHGRGSFSVQGEGGGGGAGFISSLGGLRRMPSINNTIEYDSRTTQGRVEPVVVVNPMIDDGSAAGDDKSDQQDGDADDKV